jgi:FMN phosphatase YigB (HAD superfamily)
VNNIRTITIDLDDTLWEIHPVIKRAEARLYEWLGENYPRITQMYTPAELHDVRAQIITEFADRSHDLTFLRHTVLSRVGVAEPPLVQKYILILDVYVHANLDERIPSKRFHY